MIPKRKKNKVTVVCKLGGRQGEQRPGGGWNGAEEAGFGFGGVVSVYRTVPGPWGSHMQGWPAWEILVNVGSRLVGVLL